MIKTLENYKETVIFLLINKGAIIMIDYTNRNNVSTASKAVSYDAGLRSYMIKIYNLMTGALGVSGFVAYIVANTPALFHLFYSPQGMTPLGTIAALSPLGFILAMSFGLQKMKIETLHTLFWSFAAVMGLSLSSLLIVYTGTSVARVFFITASVFGGMSLYGYTTKKDLTGFGSFLIMGLMGICIAGIVNIFLKSSGLYFVTSLISVFIFTGLIAFHTQELRNNYFIYGTNGKDALDRTAIMGALNLYLNFINLFTALLRILGRRND